MPPRNPRLNLLPMLRLNLRPSLLRMQPPSLRLMLRQSPLPKARRPKATDGLTAGRQRSDLEGRGAAWAVPRLFAFALPLAGLGGTN